MIRIDSLQNCVNGIQTIQSANITHIRTSISCMLRQAFIKPLNHLEYKSENLRATNINNESLKGRLK